MKNKLIIIVLGLLFSTGFVDAMKKKQPTKRGAVRGRGKGRQGAPVAKPAISSVTTKTASSKEDEWKRYQKLLNRRALIEEPLKMLQIIEKVEEKFAPLTLDQTAFFEDLIKRVSIRDDLQRQTALLEQQKQLELLQQQQPQVPFSVAGAAGGVAEAGKQVAKKAQSYYEWMKEKLSNALTGTYVSGMGGAKYIAPAVLIAAAGPVGLLTAGLGGLAIGGASALATGGSGLAIWGLSNIADRANFMTLSGGHATTESWMKTLRAQLLFILDNKAAYPYLSAKISALGAINELMPSTDSTGVVAQIHKAILAEYQIEKSKIPSGSAEAMRESQFNEDVKKIQKDNAFSSSTPDQYIAKLRQGNDLIYAQALVSEYNRALNRKSVQEIIAKKQAGISEATIITPEMQAVIDVGAREEEAEVNKLLENL